MKAGHSSQYGKKQNYHTSLLYRIYNICRNPCCYDFPLQTWIWKTFFALMIIATLTGCGISLALKDYLKGMIQSSTFDVAGVHNKKSLEKKLQQIQDEDDTLNTGIMMFDLNNLKVINDTYGHEEGDVFIQTFASFLTRTLQKTVTLHDSAEMNFLSYRKTPPGPS